MKVAAYCRVSTDHADQINSLESQKLYFNNYIKNNSNWEFVRIYADEGISGTQAKKRPAFLEMIKDANNKKIDLILSKEISRFARNTLDSLQYTRELKSLGVGVIFINDNINTLDPDAELRLTIMSSIAQEEVRKTSERVKWGQKRLMEQGVVFGNGVLGYNIIDRKLTINEEEAKIVKLIYHLFLNEGKGINSISRELHNKGFKSRYNTSWSPNGLLNILRNEKYVGDLLQKKYYTPNYLDHKKIINNDEEKVFLQNHHEAIIDRIMWNEVQEELRRRSPKQEHFSKYSNRHWFSGKIKCDECGSRYVLKTRKMQYGIYKVLVCNNAQTHGLPKTNSQGNVFGCNNGGINYKSLIACMQFVYEKLLINKNEILEQLKNEVVETIKSIDDANISDLERKKKAAESKKERVIDLYANNVLSLDELKQSKTKYSEEIQNYEAQIYNIKNAQSILNHKLDKIHEVFDTISSSNMSNEAVAEEVYKTSLEYVLMQSGRLTIKLKDVPFSMVLYYQTNGGKSKSFDTVISKYEIL